jgi:hypothetical protein
MNTLNLIAAYDAACAAFVVTNDAHLAAWAAQKTAHIEFLLASKEREIDPVAYAAARLAYDGAITACAQSSKARFDALAAKIRAKKAL